MPCYTSAKNPTRTSARHYLEPDGNEIEKGLRSIGRNPSIRNHFYSLCAYLDACGVTPVPF